MKAQHGFTLVELVIALTLSVVVTAFAAMFLTGPVRGYTDQARRADLVQSAESALHRISRDIRSALPNSVRIVPAGSGFALELLESPSGARYRAGPPPGDPARRLTFNSADDSFNVLGGFASLGLPFSSNTHYLSIYNAGVPGASAWELSNVITPPGTQVDIVADAIPGEFTVSLVPAFRFSYPSPSSRVYLVSGPVTWLCDPVAGTLTRFSNYSISSNQTDRDSAVELLGAGGRSARAAQYLAGCSASYQPGTAQRSGLVTVQLQLASSGEQIALLHQFHVENAP